MRIPTAGDFFRLATLGIIWGSSFTAIRAAVEFISPLQLAAIRIVIAAVILLLFVRWRGYAFPRTAGTWAVLALVGCLNSALPFFLINWGEQVVESGTASILMAASPLTALLLSHFTTSDDRVTPSKAVGIALGVAGVAVLFGPGALAGLGEHLAAQAAILGAAICYAVASVLARRTSHVHPYAATTAAMICSAVIIAPLSLILEPLPEQGFDLVEWSLILYLALIPTAAAALLLFRIIADAGASFMSQVNFIVPVTGVLLGALLLGEQIGLQECAALALVLGGIAVSRISWRRKSG
jgi:drug/metabolite transporter (DMT)-like permease